MARRKEENEATETVKVERYTIAWPKELLDIQPIFKVPVSATREAHVYEHTRKEWAKGEGGVVTFHGYYIRFVITKTGIPPRNTDEQYHHYRQREEFYHTLLDVKVAIEDYSATVQPKIKTVTQKVKVEVNGDDEE